MYDLFAFVFQNSFLLRGTVLFFFGIIIGSFLNVVIYRLPIMLKRQWHNEAVEILGDLCKISPDTTHFNLIYPTSHCRVCDIKIPFWANIPILSYFLLRGKCHNCKATISFRYPAIELITGLLFVIAGYLTNDTITLPGYLIFISFVLCLILIDYDTFVLPDILTLSLLWLGILFNLEGSISGSIVNSIFGAVTGYIFLWLVFWIFKLITRRDGLGYGDFKFLAAILAWVGYQALVPMLLFASTLGIIYFILAKITGRLISHPNISGSHVPFGPFLGIAGLIVLFGGAYVKILPF